MNVFYKTLLAVTVVVYLIGNCLYIGDLYRRIIVLEHGMQHLIAADGHDHP